MDQLEALVDLEDYPQPQLDTASLKPEAEWKDAIGELISATTLIIGDNSVSMLRNMRELGRNWGNVQLTSMRDAVNTQGVPVGLHLEDLNAEVVFGPTGDTFSIISYPYVSTVFSVDQYNWPDMLDGAYWQDKNRQTVGNLDLTREQVKPIILGEAIILYGQLEFEGKEGGLPSHTLDVAYYADFVGEQATLIRAMGRSKARSSGYDSVQYFYKPPKQGNNAQNQNELVFSFAGTQEQQEDNGFAGDTRTMTLPLVISMSDLQMGLIAPVSVVRTPNEVDSRRCSSKAFAFPLKITG